MGSIITSNGESLVCEREREREIPASTTRSLFCQSMLMKIVYIMGSEGHFGSMSNEREREYLAKLLELSAGG